MTIEYSSRPLARLNPAPRASGLWTAPHPHIGEQTLINRAKSYPQMGLRHSRVFAYCLPNFRNVFSGALVHLPMGE